MSEVIDHVAFRVSDLGVSRRMYEAALAELGFAVLSEGEFEDDAYVLFGRGESDDFALHSVGSKPGRDNGPPGLRPEYAGTYYAAFVLDPDGTTSRPSSRRPSYLAISERRKPPRRSASRPRGKHRV